MLPFCSSFSLGFHVAYCDWNLVVVFQCETVDPADAAAIAKTVLRALALYGSAALEEMRQNCMAQDFSWKVISSQINSLSHHQIMLCETMSLFWVIYAGASQAMGKIAVELGS